MNIPFEKKDNHSNMTLFEYLMNNKDKTQTTNLANLGIDFLLAAYAVEAYVKGEEIDNNGPSLYIPTTYNFVTGERMSPMEAQKRLAALTAARIGAYNSSEFQEISDIAMRYVRNGMFSISFISLWKLYQIAPYIYDLPLCKEQCLIKLAPSTLKQILEYAKDSVSNIPSSAQYLSNILYNVLSEFSGVINS